MNKKIELEGYIISHEFVLGEECTCDVEDECTCGNGSPCHFEIPGLPRKYFPEDGIFGSNLDAWEMDQFERIGPRKVKFRLTIEVQGENCED